MPSKEKKSDIDLTVIMFAYNHAPYIREALESVLNQKTKYKYEIIITDDGSSDGTAEVIREYESKYPEIIKAYLEEKNCGNPRDIIMKYSAYPRGNYWCLLETDDYWTSDEKIEKQLDFLYANPSYIGANHNTLIKNEITKEESVIKAYLPEWDIKILIEQFITPCYALYCHTSSWMWKNIFKNPKAWFDFLKDKNTYGDTLLSFRLLSYGGKVKHLDEVMSCYRMTGNGVWSKLSENEQKKQNSNLKNKIIKSLLWKPRIYFYYYSLLASLKKIPIFILIFLIIKVLKKICISLVFKLLNILLPKRIVEILKSIFNNKLRNLIRG